MWCFFPHLIKAKKLWSFEFYNQTWELNNISCNQAHSAASNFIWKKISSGMLNTFIKSKPQVEQLELEDALLHICHKSNSIFTQLWTMFEKRKLKETISTPRWFYLFFYSSLLYYTQTAVSPLFIPPTCSPDPPIPNFWYFITIESKLW